MSSNDDIAKRLQAHADRAFGSGAPRPVPPSHDPPAPLNITAPSDAPGPGEPGYSQDLRGDIAAARERSEAPAKMATTDTGWTGQVLEFVGLAFVLVPPGLLGEAFLKSEPINWQLMIAIFAGYWAVGALVLLAGKAWPKWRLSNATIATVIEMGAHNIWVWLALLVVFAFGPSLVVAGLSRGTAPAP